MPRPPLPWPASWLLVTLIVTALALLASVTLSLPPALTGEEPLAASAPDRLARAAALEQPVLAAAGAVAAWEADRGLDRFATASGAPDPCTGLATNPAAGPAAAPACVALARDLAEWARRLDALWQALPPYRAALHDLDDAEMARTRLLGGAAEDLRPATWPIVEHLKLYPDAERDYGAALADAPPADLAARFAALAAWAAAPATVPAVPADPETTLAALRRTRAGVLRWAELDLRYGATLRDYDTVVAHAAASPRDRGPLRQTLGWLGYALAMLAAVGGAVGLGVAGLTSPPTPPQRGEGRGEYAQQLRWRLSPPHAGEGLGVRLNLPLLLLSLGLYYLSPSLPLAAVAAVAWVGLAWWRLEVALAVVVVAIPLQFHPRAVGSLSFSLAEFAVVAGGVAWFGRLVWGWRRPGGWGRLGVWWQGVRRSPLLWPAVLFLVAGTVSLAVARGEHLREAVRAYRLEIVEPVLFGLLVGLTLGRRGVWLAVSVAVVVAALIGAHATGQYLLGQGVSPMEGVDRVASVYPSATALALCLGRVAPLAVALALFGGPAGEAGRRQRWACGLLLLPILTGLLVTWTRGAWLGVWLAVLVMLLVGSRWRLAAGWLALAVVGAAGLALSRVERLASLFSLADGTNVSRLLIWQAALAALHDHPLTGIGLDQFLTLDRARYDVPDVRFLLLSHPHNAILDLWLSLGLLGLVAGLWLAVALVRTLLRLARRDGSDAGTALTRALALGLLGSVVDAVAHGMVDLSYFVPDLALWWWLVVGLTEALRRAEAGPTPAPAPAGDAQTARAAPVRSGT